MSISSVVSRLRFWAPIFFIPWCYYLGLRDAVSYFAAYNPHSIRVDIDTSLLADAVVSHPHLVQTWDWWTGPWYAAVPYFRPLSMMGFWTQYQIFGEHNLLAFEGLHWWYHGLVLVLLFGFWSQVAGRGRAALAVGMFAAGANIYAEQVTGLDAFNCWKDSADIWHLSFFILSSWMFLLFLRRERWHLLGFSLIFWFCAVAVKESGYCLPFMLPVLLWHEKKLRSHWSYALIFFVLAPLLWAYRWHVLGGWGNRYGSNGAWLHRVIVDGVGLPGYIANGDTLTLAVIFAALIGVWGWRVRECGEPNRAWPPLLLGVLALASLAQAARFISSNAFDALALLSLSRTWEQVGFAVLMAALYLQFVLRRDRTQIFAAAWIAVTFIPLAMQPPTSSHVHYPVAPGWSLFLACALWSLLSSLKSAAQWLKPVPRAKEAPAL